MKDAIMALFDTAPSRPPQGPYEPAVIMLVDAVLAGTDHDRIWGLASDIAWIAQRQIDTAGEPKSYALIKQVEFKGDGLTARTFNLLRAEGVRTFGDLLSYTSERLLKIKGFGLSNLMELNRAVAEHGIHFNLPAAEAC